MRRSFFACEHKCLLISILNFLCASSVVPGAYWAILGAILICFGCDQKKGWTSWKHVAGNVEATRRKKRCLTSAPTRLGFVVHPRVCVAITPRTPWARLRESGGRDARSLACWTFDRRVNIYRIGIWSLCIHKVTDARQTSCVTHAHPARTRPNKFFQRIFTAEKFD